MQFLKVFIRRHCQVTWLVRRRILLTLYGELVSPPPPPPHHHPPTLPSPCTAFSQSLSVNSFGWRIRGERAGNALTFSHGPRDPKRFGREEKWGLGTRQPQTHTHTQTCCKNFARLWSNIFARFNLERLPLNVDSLRGLAMDRQLPLNVAQQCRCMAIR